MASLRRSAKVLGGMLVMILRSFTLWAFLLPSAIAWLLAAIFWPFARAFGKRIPARPGYYFRWATTMHDALLSRLLPIESMPWPWQTDLHNSSIRTWTEAY